VTKKAAAQSKSTDKEKSMTTAFWATRDSLTAWRDEDRGMAHVTVCKNVEDEVEARKALAEYMINEGLYLIKEYGPDATYAGFRMTKGSANLLKRAGQLIEQAACIVNGEGEFPGEKDWEAINFDVDGLRFQLVKINKEDK
jgi:hypothetical protein